MSILIALSSRNTGQSLLEVIIAMALFVLIVPAMASLSLGGFRSLEQGGKQTEAEALAQEGIEALHSIRDKAWNELKYATSSVSISAGGWNMTGEGSTETIGEYTRTISFYDVCRDPSKNIASCSSVNILDPHIKKVEVEVEWQNAYGITSSVSRQTYLSNWESRDWVQTNWSGGIGQSVWSDTSKYDNDNNNIDIRTTGEFKLGATASTSWASWSISGGSTLIDTTDTDFNQGTFTDTATTGSDVDASVILASNKIWSFDPRSQIATTQNLYAIDSLSATDIWSAGASGKILRYDGISWNEFQDVGSMNIFGIDMLSTTDGWAVGNTGVIYRYNGVTWNLNIDTGNEQWNDVNMVSSSNGWAIGNSGAIANYNGSWNNLTPISAQNFNALDMISSSDGWLVGGGGTVRHYDGSNWVSSGGKIFTDTTDTDFNAGTFSNTIATSTSNPSSVVLSKMIGGGWAESANSGAITEPLNAISVLSPTDIWAVAQSRKIMHYNGIDWIEFADLGPKPLWDIDMVSATDGWTAGKSGEIYRFNGTSWTLFQNVANVVWAGIYMVSATDGWAVGDKGVVYRYDGTTWSQYTDIGNIYWSDVYMVSATDGWIVGNAGEIYRFNGSSWNLFQDVGSQVLWSVNMVSATDGWIVGDGGVIFRFNGSAWSSVSSPVATNLYNVYMISSSSGWASGASGKILRYDGSAWSEFLDIGDQNLYAVAFFSSSGGFVVGDNGQIYGYGDFYEDTGTFNSRIFDSGSSGTSWSSVNWIEILPEGSDITISTRTGDVAIPDGTWSAWSVEVTDANGSTIVSPNGRYIQYRATFTRATYPSQTPQLDSLNIIYDIATTNNLNDVFAVSSSDVWAVGNTGTIIHYDGTNWTATTSPVTDNLRSIYMVSATDGWVGGASGKILHYDGVSWTEFFDAGGMTWNSILMTSANNGWLVGDTGYIMHYNDFYKTSGTFSSRILDGGASAIWNSLYWTQVLYVGSNITISTRTGNTSTPDGTWSAWSTELTNPDSAVITSPSNRYLQYRATITRGTFPEETPFFQDITIIYNSVVTQVMQDVDIVSENDVWSVGGSGVILHYDGSSWSQFQDMGNQDIWSVDMVETSDGWASGASGKIYRYNGTSWSEFVDLGNMILNDINLISSNDGWVVGSNGSIYRWNGTNWIINTSPVGSSINSLYMLSSTDGWAVGDGGKILHYDGTSWSQFQDTGGESWKDIFMTSATDGWLIGNGGRIYRYNGTTWSLFVDTGNQTWYSAYLVNSNDGWIMGSGGEILLWNGTNWSASLSPVTSTLYSVVLISPFQGWAVGANTIIKLFITNGYLISSAFNVGSNKTFQVVDWDEILPSCVGCRIRAQIRTAPDNVGVPGTWINWYGASGINGYFSTSTGYLVPIPSLLNNNPWVQYKILLTGDGINTPTVQETRVNYK